MMHNGNKQGIRAAYAVVAALSLIVMLTLAYLYATDYSISHHYRDPELSELLVRGSITDRSGELLAIQAPDYGFSISLERTSAPYAASIISRFTTEPAISIEDRIKGGEDFIAIPMIPSLDELNKIEAALEEAGIGDDVRLAAVEKRKYPHGDDPLIGMVDSSFHGVSGLEKLLDGYLKAKPSPFERIARGSDVKLTINATMQDNILKLGLEGNAAVLSKEGELLAFSGIPDNAVLSSAVSTITSFYGNNIEFNKVPFPYETEPISEEYSIYIENEADKAKLVSLLAELAL